MGNLPEKIQQATVAVAIYNPSPLPAATVFRQTKQRLRLKQHPWEPPLQSFLTGNRL
jgi:hypothetical protein